jgi:glyoxylase-like metal-dependent hydrolase (beta-lactamase superfamily II)
MLTGRGGNIGACIGEDGVFLIDDQYAPLTPAIRQALAQVTDAPVRFVLNTHWHSDHTGGNENFGELGAVIVAHDNVRERLASDQFMPFMDRQVPASPPAALPVVTFNDTVSFHMNGNTIRAFHVAGAHTDGDAIVHFDAANVVHMGDVFWNGWYPFIDVHSGGSIRGVIAAVEAVLAMIDGDTAVIAGHGPLGDRARLLVYRDMLQDVADRIQEMIDDGRTLEEIQSAAPTSAWDGEWGSGFIKPEAFVRMVHEDLAGR